MFRTSVRLSSPVWRYVAMAADALLILGGALASYFWHFGRFADNLMPEHYIMLVMLAVLLMFFGSGSIYKSRRGDDLLGIVGPVAVAWGVVLAVLIAGLFATKSSTDISRLWFGGWAVGTLVALLALRLFVYFGLHWLRSAGFNFKSVVIVGEGPIGLFAQKAVDESAWSGLRVLAVVPPDQLAPCLGANVEREPDEVWLCLPLGDKTGIETALHALRHSTANIRLVPDWFSLKLINHGISEMVGLHMLDLSTSPITGTTYVVKAIEDFLLGLLILLLVSPVMLVIALAVKLTSPGPVLFMQKRHGWNGEDIWVYKFRSMVQHRERGFEVTQATPDDPRITPLGMFLRRTSLDELPQFINVLQGRMSIVGPRPHAVQHNEIYKDLVPGYMLRHKVKPGITGWAQINGFRGETDTLDKMEQRVQHDLHYVENLSLWLDLKIIVLTVFKGFVHHNAR